MLAALVYLLLGTSAIATLYALIVRPRLRAARLKPVRRALSAALTSAPERSRCPEQDHLTQALRSLEEVDKFAHTSEARARAARLPIPPAAAPGTPPEDQLRGLADLLNDPRVMVAVAGGEQLVGSLFDMAVPGAMGMLGEAAVNGFWAGVQSELAMPDEIVKFGFKVTHALLEEGGIHLKQAALTAAQGLAEYGLPHAVDGVCDHLGEAFDPSNAHGAHFPIVTTLLSGMRELRLLRQEKTSIERAVGHVALDTGATAAGGIAGGKVGAAVGTAIAPGLGTAIGAAVGGIIGSMGGRLVATTVKHQPLKTAVNEYAETAKAAESAIEASSLDLLAEVQKTAHKAASDYERSIPPAPGLERPDGSAPIVRATLALRSDIVAHLRSIETARGLALSRAQNLVPAASGLDRFLGLDVWAEAASSISDARERLFKQQHSLPSASLPDDVSIRQRPLEACLALAAAEWPDGSKLAPQFGAAAQAVADSQKVLLKCLGGWAGRVAQNYQEKATQITTCLHAETHRHQSVIATQRFILDRKRQAVEKQRIALGR